MSHSEGVIYTRVCYIGDGRNDYCPAVRLSADDYIFPRKDYPLDNKLREDDSKVKAKVVAWDSGNEICDALQNM